MKLVITIVAVLGVAAWLALGLFIAQGPQPEIVLPAEVITKVGPLNLTNSLITAWISMAFIIIVSIAATRSMKLMPGGIQNFVEAGVGFLVDQCEEIAGERNGRQFFTVVATIFIFIIISNWMALLPIFNSIGKTEDVGHEIFHLMQEQEADGKPFEEVDAHDAWVMEDAGSVVYTKPRGETFDFEFHAGEEASSALDRYIVALAIQFTDFEAADAENPGAATVTAAATALEDDPSAPMLLTDPSLVAGDSEPHAVESATTDLTVYGIEFPDQKLAIVVPFFRSAFSDINNTLAIAIIAFVMIEFWGIQRLGIGYLRKFFVNPIKSPIANLRGRPRTPLRIHPHHQLRLPSLR